MDHNLHLPEKKNHLLIFSGYTAQPGHHTAAWDSVPHKGLQSLLGATPSPFPLLSPTPSPARRPGLLGCPSF